MEAGGQQSGAAEETQGRVADVEFEQAAEEAGVAANREKTWARRRGERSSKRSSPGHAVREAAQRGVRLLVLGEVVGGEGVGEGERLAEAEGEAFAGDGVDRAGGVADEGDVAAGDAVEPAAEGDGAARGVAGRAEARCAGAAGSRRGRRPRWGTCAAR